MSDIYEKLFDCYGDQILRESGCRKEMEIMRFVDALSVAEDTKVEISDYLSNSYYRWSTNAFALGMHLGLSLSNNQISGSRPQKGQ